VPAARKKRTGRGSHPHKGKKPEDAQLFILSALVFILFALLVSLILTVRKADPRNPPLAIQNAPVAENDPPTENVPQTENAPDAATDSPKSPPENAVPVKKKSGGRTPETARKPKTDAPERIKPELIPESKSKLAAPPERPSKGYLIIIIDDVGDNVWQLKPFLELPGPVTFAIKPGLAFTKESRDLIVAAGKDYIIHQPMEALDKLDPGPGALYSGMEDAKIQSILEKNFRELPDAKGMNNHMGSVTTKDLRIMRQVLRFTKSKGIPFLDSRTIGGTATQEAARLENAVYGERDVFLDNSPEKENILAMVKDGMKKSEKQGRAVMIGHVWSAELAQTLMELYPELVNEGYSLSTISKIMVGDEDADPGY
jgi:polysaccharide deacetylase 2 family uncharacterized protein YibQ